MTIGVFFGSRSPEHDVSIITGELIISGLRALGYTVVPIYLDREGRWCISDQLGSIDFFRKSENKPAQFSVWNLDTENSRGKLVFRKKGLLSKELVIDVAFPAFHGENGEDGTAQGLFELFNVPYIGCGVAASAITMDKVLTKQLYERHGLPTTKFMYFYKKDWDKNRESFITKIKTGLQAPWFVKPARLGSSIGIAKVTNEKDLVFAVDVALHYDEKVLVEEAVEPMADITCAVLGNKTPQPSLLQESVFNDAFFSYEDKYITKGGAQLGKAQSNLMIPARLDPDMTTMIQNLACQVFIKLECAGIARVDFLYNSATKKVFVNEVNTLPGTLYHHLWEKSGVPLPQLLTRLIELAKERHAEKQTFTHTFKSAILKQGGGDKLQKKI